MVSAAKGEEVSHYKYRLTITFKSGSQWKLGIETLFVADDIVRELDRNVDDINNICLSYEKKGKVIWIKPGKDMLS